MSFPALLKLESYRFYDLMVLGYLLLIPLLIAVAPHETAYQLELSLAHILIFLIYIGLIQLSLRPKAHKGMVALRDWLPLLLVGPFYSEATFINTIFFDTMLDPVFRHWDQILFGAPLVHTLAGSTPLWLREFVHALYFSYYFIYGIPALIFYFRNRADFHHYVAAVMFIEIIHYLLIILIPAIGPIPLRESVFTEGYLFIPLMDAIYAAGEHGGAAFPSAHVAVSIYLGYFLGKYFQTRGRITLGIWITGIVFSTVFCGYHYGVDVIAGVVSGLLSLIAFKWIYPRTSF